jgi:uncharacterized protein YbaP (TraB family)
MKQCKKQLKVMAILLLLSVSLVHAQKEATIDDLENSLLWEISGNGLEQPSYLFGTIHVIPKNEYFFTKRMKESFSQCEQLVLEIDIDIPMKEQLALAYRILLPDGKKLRNYLNEDEYTKLQHYFRDSLQLSNQSLKMTESVQPFYVTAIILNDLIGKTVAYEQKLTKRAKKGKMHIAALETYQDQLAMVDSISIEDQIKFSYMSMMGNDIVQAYLDLIEVYKKQELNSLLALSMQDSLMNKFDQSMLIDRNNNWIPKIESLIQEKPSFIAVGAAHLPGQEGVIRLLRKEGYEVKAVR